MKKPIDYITYLKLFSGILLPSMLSALFWSLNFGIEKGIYISVVMHLATFLIGSLILNYLEGESPLKLIRTN